MTPIGHIGQAAALAVTAALAFSSVGAAQQARTPKKQTAAPKQPSPEQGRAQASGGQPTLLGQFGDWGAYTATTGGRKVCYALSKPTSQQTNPPNRPRDPAYFMISTRPAENVRDEVFIMIGYPFKSGSEASVQVGSDKYAMYTQNDGAWIKNAAEEPRMVEALRKGADAVVTGTSSRGTVSTDKYSLRGLSQALERAAQDCR